MSDDIYIGDLNKRLALKQIVTVESATTNEPLKSEQDFKAVWAKTDDVSGNESIDGRVIALNVRKYTVRYNEGIYLKASNLLAIDKDGTYNVNSVELVGNKEYLTLKCSRRE